MEKAIVLLFWMIISGSVNAQTKSVNANHESAAEAKGAVSQVWVADLGNGMYKNPILHADYSDPDAIRVGNDFYMTSSSFEDVPGSAHPSFQRPGELDAYWPCPEQAASLWAFFHSPSWWWRMGTIHPSPQWRVLSILSRSGLWHLSY